MVFVIGLWDVGPWVLPCLGLIVRDCKSINKLECMVEVEVLRDKYK
jgi:hypothetical protein